MSERLGLCYPQGFLAAGIHVGVKKNSGDKKDLALVFSERACTAAGLYTTNQVRGACIELTKDHLDRGPLHGFLANSGNANACTGKGGYDDALKMTQLAAAALNKSGHSVVPEQLALASTGVIGQRLNMTAVEAGLPQLAKALSVEGGQDAMLAIMTTDTKAKIAMTELNIGGCGVRLGAMAKGSGMIHPNMATLLCFVTTDCSISETALKAAFGSAIEASLNQVSVDGDTSTNDMALVLANGAAANARIEEAEGPAFEIFRKGLTKICTELAIMVAQDGEGATKLLRCEVEGAVDDNRARSFAKTVISSSLVKAAFFGADANWGRILCALGYSGLSFDATKTNIQFQSAEGKIEVCKGGMPLNFDETQARKILNRNDITINIQVGEGQGRGQAWGCDLSYEYVKINGDYRT